MRVLVQRTTLSRSQHLCTSRQSTISLLLHKLLLCECYLCASETGPLCLLAQRTSLSRNTHLHTTDTYCTLSLLHYKHTKRTTPSLNNTSPLSLHFQKNNNADFIIYFLTHTDLTFNQSAHGRSMRSKLRMLRPCT